MKKYWVTVDDCIEFLEGDEPDFIRIDEFSKLHKLQVECIEKLRQLSLEYLKLDNE